MLVPMILEHSCSGSRRMPDVLSWANSGGLSQLYRAVLSMAGSLVVCEKPAALRGYPAGSLAPEITQ